MTRHLILAAAGFALIAGAPAAIAAPCKDAKGKFIKCPAKPQRCKLNGKFAKCGTHGAKPA